MRKAAAAVAMALLATSVAMAEPPEPSVILESGGAGQWGLHGGSAFGPNFGAETTPIPGLLELEADVTPFMSRGQTEWDSDFLFKKPFDLNRSLEFMIGVGPEWGHTVTHAGTSDDFGMTVAGDFMFWPMRERRWGFYLEPAYGYGFGRDHEQSFNVSFGLLIPIR